MNDAPDLQPVVQFHEADELEQQLKALTLDLIGEYFRFYEREINAYGMPHLADFELIERWVKSDGLAMVRANSQDAMRYLFKAWRSRNPKRGLHFLRTYLQLLWPDGWAAEQLWQRKDKAYPEGLVSTLDTPIAGDPRRDYYLTSRVNIDVYAEGEDGKGLSSVARALRTTLSAKFVVMIRLLRNITTQFEIVNTGQASEIRQAYGGTDPGITPEPFGFGVFDTGQASQSKRVHGGTDPGVTPEPAYLGVYGHIIYASVTCATTEW